MNEEQKAIADLAYNQITEALSLLMRVSMNTVTGIAEVRQAVVNARNAVNLLD
jgi:hypothetical protein